jgi:hypothetical protein
MLFKLDFVLKLACTVFKTLCYLRNLRVAPISLSISLQ